LEVYIDYNSHFIENININISSLLSFIYTMKIFILFSITFAFGFLKIVSNAYPLPYEAIFNFGDSTSDTGNAAFGRTPMDKRSPYGSTYFKHPAGRMSDGRLIIDFIGNFTIFFFIS